MKQESFSSEQIVAILKQSERRAEHRGLVQGHGVTVTTFYRWRRQFGGMSFSETQRLPDMDKENARLKRLLVKRCMEVDVLKEALAKTSKRSPEKSRRCLFPQS